MVFRGFCLNFATSLGKSYHRGTGFRRGGVTALGLHLVFHVHHTLFGNADKTTRSGYTGEDVLHNGATLIENKKRLNVVLFKIINYINGALTVDLLATREGKIDVVFGCESIFNVMVHRRKYSVEGDLCVKGSATPKNAFFYFTAERRLVPKLLIYGNHVVVRHQHNGRFITLSRPFEKQCAVGQFAVFTVGKHIGIEIGQSRQKFPKFSLVL